MLGVIRILVLDFILYFVIAYVKKYPIHANQHRVQHIISYTSLEELSKKSSMKNNLQW